MLNFHKNHRNLVVTSLLVFVGLSVLIAVVPASEIQRTKPLPSMKDFSKQERAGLNVYVAENCVACHTQQVRNIEMDNVWGSRPSMPSDYYFSKKRLDFWRQSPSILGSERTGPDLTNIGKRQAGKEWHLLHLYNPRIVVKESIMPGYPWLFEEKDASQVSSDEVVVAVPEQFRKGSSRKIVATQKALDLVAYLLSLKQADIEGEPGIKFIPAKKKNTGTDSQTQPSGPDGATLYTNTCGACHQADGKGLAGAFPPLAGSTIVNDNDPELMIKIILQGYDARAEYAVMAPFADMLNDDEIAAIATHERSSWGNNAPAITAEMVKKIRESIKTISQK
ncbi:MAG: cytochrome c [Bacteroidia bacterium]|nr:cytochrome c [Bacteroidia bacterium]MCZ2277516.1 cytochrome c [Bacteroidia bacterium]